MKSLLIKALAMLTWASKTVIEFLLPILQSQTAALLEDLLPTALVIVRDLASREELSGAQKRDEALKQPQSIAIDYGMQAATSVLNLSIEMAVAKMREAGK